MRRLWIVIAVSGLAAGGLCVAQARPAAQPPSFAPLFNLVGDFPLDDGTNRIDYQSIDPATHRLYISKMGAGKLLVVDITQNSLIAQLDNFPKITGVLVVPELHRVYASVPGAGLGASLSVALGMAGLSKGHGAVVVVDTRNLHEIARLPGGVFPDGIAYDPRDHRIFVSDELGSSVAVIDADTDRLITRIDAGGEVGNVRYDPATSRVYAPIQSHDELIVIDPVKATIVGVHPLTGGRHPHGLAIAPDEAVGYVACDSNDQLLTVNLATGKVLDRQNVAHDPDVLAIDTGGKRLYVASESGRLSTFDIKNAGKPVSVGDIFIGKDAHSVAVDPTTRRLYLPLADVDGRSILRVLSPTP